MGDIEAARRAVQEVGLDLARQWNEYSKALRVKVRIDEPTAQMPTRAYPGDAGFDLHYSGTSPLHIQPDEVVSIPSHVAMQFPEGVWGLIIGRSSTFQRGLLVNTTVIDSGWRGQLCALVRNVSHGWVTVEPGERIAQIVPMLLPAESYKMLLVDELDQSERGTQGFGSSGR